MAKLDSFEKRASYGQEAVDKTVQLCETLGIKYETVVSVEEWKKANGGKKNWPEIERLNKIDLEEGDLKILGHNFDVKRNAISFKSLDNFKGKYFIIYHHDLEAALVIEGSQIKKLDRTYFSDELSSGDRGIKYYNLRKLPNTPLRVFLNRYKDQTA